jgi:nucleoside diphosphate kinase
MAKELAFVLINPYPIRKSRTGGIIARYLARTDMKLAGARLFGGTEAWAADFSNYLASYTDDPVACELCSTYVARNYAPDKTTGRRHRFMALLFEGENAIEKIYHLTGSARLTWGSGQSVRDTFGDLVRDDAGNVKYFEPAVLVGRNPGVCQNVLRLLKKHFEHDSGFVHSASDVPVGEDVEQTLVMLKPDNFRQPSLRAGNIVDLFSGSGLRIVAVKKFPMSVNQALEFYGPVRENLRKAFANFGPGRAAQALASEFGFPVDTDAVAGLCDTLAPIFANREFENIVEFMAGRRPSQCPEEERDAASQNECLALAYEGVGAVNKIRDILGSTDPNKARPGSIRREFGTNIMVNAAHASDSVGNAAREMGILDIERDLHFWELITGYHS